MPADLTTTNVLLGIMAAVSLLEAAAVVVVFAGAMLVYRRVVRLIAGIEERHVAPAAARVNAILDDVKTMTATAKQEAERIDALLRGFSRIFSRDT
jgi:hypothetical protein